MTTRRRWTDSTISAELDAVANELGHVPSRRELTERGLGGLWSAMQRRGGIDTWRRRVLAPHIERRAYFLSLERDGDPVDHWLTAERELLAA